MKENINLSNITLDKENYKFNPNQIFFSDFSKKE